MDQKELKEFLDDKYRQYNVLGFIENDPVSIPHQFTRKEDIEIAGFLAATLAWGQRVTIINKCNYLLGLMDRSPYGFITSFGDSDLKMFQKFAHRTFNGGDCIYFISALKNLYNEFGSIENVFTGEFKNTGNLFQAIIKFRAVFLSYSPLKRTGKHVANVSKGAGAKRLNMYLRWMVRKEGAVDFGIWGSIPPSALYMPLDLHTGNVSRKLGILNRKQDDWKAVEELTHNLRDFDQNDPVKYDFALFGLGINEKF